MKLLRATIKNYKSIRQSEEIYFANGFNVFIGQNDAGKSALLEALSTRAKGISHRSLSSAPTEFTQNESTTQFDFSFALSPDDLNNFFSSQQSIWLPTYTASSQTPQVQIAQEHFTKSLQNGDEFFATWVTTQSNTSAAPSEGFLKNMASLDHRRGFTQFSNLERPHGVKLSVTNSTGGAGYGVSLAELVARGIYSFRAERLALSRSTSKGGEYLEANASNLPEVLNILQTKHTHLWKKYIDHVRTIFPHITEVKAIYTSSNEVEIRISTEDPSLSRADLDVSLADSGSGVGQVLAMLYVVVRNTHPQIILIDEPQSFLHPGALRKLLEILRMYDKHQYILTTHSPISIPLADADKMFLLLRTQKGSQVKPITERDDLVAALSDIGARLGDVYGAEAILWVEGPTEERCFPEIIRGIGNKQLQGAAVIGVVTTGELEAKDAKRVCEIYERLTKSSALLPKTVAFMFDREGRSDADRQDLSRRLGGLMHWLPLRMYENYLLQPEAIAHVLNELRGSAEPKITREKIEDWLSAHGGEAKYFDGSTTFSYGHENWLSAVHGAKLLDALFYDLTKDSGAHEYQKVKHGLQLTRYLVTHPTDLLRQLASELAGILDQNSS